MAMDWNIFNKNEGKIVVDAERLLSEPQKTRFTSIWVQYQYEYIYKLENGLRKKTLK